jgi:hypothetical protein
MNNGIQISGGSFVGGAFAAGDGARATAGSQPSSGELEIALQPLSEALSELRSPKAAAEIEQAMATLRRESTAPQSDKSKVTEALGALGKAEPAIKGVSTIVASIATLFGLA